MLDEREENVIRLELTSTGFPKGFPMSAFEEQISWDYVKIGDSDHLLPVSADFISASSSGEMRLTRHEYKNHRHFEASSNITFH